MEWWEWKPHQSTFKSKYFHSLLSKLRNKNKKSAQSISILTPVLTSLNFLLIFQLLENTFPWLSELNISQAGFLTSPIKLSPPLSFSVVFSYLHQKLVNPPDSPFFSHTPHPVHLCLSYPHSKSRIWPHLLSIIVSIVVHTTVVSCLNYWGSENPNWSFCCLSSFPKMSLPSSS